MTMCSEDISEKEILVRKVFCSKWITRTVRWSTDEHTYFRKMQRFVFRQLKFELLGEAAQRKLTNCVGFVIYATRILVLFTSKSTVFVTERSVWFCSPFFVYVLTCSYETKYIRCKIGWSSERIRERYPSVVEVWNSSVGNRRSYFTSIQDKLWGK